MVMGTETGPRQGAAATCCANDAGRARRGRLEQVVGLARAYRAWSVGELAAHLGRTASKLLPTSGNPKLDLVARLADALDWEVGEVAESLWFAEPARVDGRFGAMRLAELDELAQRAHRTGDFATMEAVGLAMRAIAMTGGERAIAANRLAGAYDGMGRYQRVLACVREGLAEQQAGAEVRTMLSVNLANAHATLWNLREAEAVATMLIAELRDPARRSTRIGAVAWAYAHAVRGHALRRALSQPCGAADLRFAAVRAEGDLLEAERLFLELWERHGDGLYRGLANTALGGAIEAGVAAGRLEPLEAVASIVERLDAVVDPAQSPGELAESWGWWSVFGANIAFRAGDSHAGLRRERPDLERAIAICTNKAVEIADHLEHWPMRERALTLEWSRRTQAAREAGLPPEPWTLDDDDVRVLVGTMGRFPLFRPTGWAILGASATP